MACSRRHIIARPPPGRIPLQNSSKSDRHAWAGLAATGEPDGLDGWPPLEEIAPTADWHSGDKDDMFWRKHCSDALPPVGTPAHSA